MSKKTFATAPRPRQPTAEEIDAYERSGTGHDRVVVHTRFKTACSATGRKMVGEIHAFIERRVAELESEAGISRK